jgi:hypothetical protein
LVPVAVTVRVKLVPAACVVSAAGWAVIVGAITLPPELELLEDDELDDEEELELEDDELPELDEEEPVPLELPPPEDELLLEDDELEEELEDDELELPEVF